MKQRNGVETGIFNMKTMPSNSKKGFSFLAGINRIIIPSQVSKLAESVQTMGLVRPIVVAICSFINGTTGMYIIDGQHLYTALLRLKMDIPYVFIDVKDMPDLINKIAMLNSSSKSWTLQNYIDTWGYYKPDYQEFMRLFNMYNIERGTLAELLHTGIVSVANISGGRGVTKAIKKGTFRIINKEMAIKVLDYVSDLRTITKDLGRIEQKLLIQVMIEKIKSDGGKYDHKAYKAYLIKIKPKLLLASNDVDTLRNLLSK